MLALMLSTRTERPGIFFKITTVVTLVGSVIILLVTRSIFGLRVSNDSQEEGLDVSEHGQSGYKL